MVFIMEDTKKFLCPHLWVHCIMGALYYGCIVLWVHCIMDALYYGYIVLWMQYSMDFGHIEKKQLKMPTKKPYRHQKSRK